MPIILILAVLAVLLLSRSSAAAAGGPGVVNGAGLEESQPRGPSTGAAAQWQPPTDIVITKLTPLAPGENRYGGNEADPRIAGGCWTVPETGVQCCYDRTGSSSFCNDPRDPCEVEGTTSQLLRLIGKCPPIGGASAPGAAPPPPPPPPRTDGGAPPPPPVFGGFATREGIGHF